MEGLVGMQDFIEAVKGRAKEQVLLKTIDALLRLLRDTCNFIINTLSQTDAGMYTQELLYIIYSATVFGSANDA